MKHASFHEWRGLSEPERREWLEAARERFFAEDSDFAPSAELNRVVALEGDDIDSLIGFYCAMGEAVNGPGGYFGKSMQSFDDCLFGGFGLGSPYTIIWRSSATSKRVLDHNALIAYLDDECVDPQGAEAEEWAEQTRKAALGGERTMFDEIVESIQTVPERNGPKVSLRLE